MSKKTLTPFEIAVIQKAMAHEHGKVTIVEAKQIANQQFNCPKLQLPNWVGQLCGTGLFRRNSIFLKPTDEAIALYQAQTEVSHESPIH